ncbi:MAG: hypothetical protein GEU92_18810 [Alphaproteobacteria bacterium]|nr:hypothetical protein [Alphaproteobacteria bacterium]
MLDNITFSHWLYAKGAVALAVVAIASLSACGVYNQAPREVQASNPTVTYSYQGDQELVAANSRATTHCAQYSATPRTVSILDETDGTKSVVFECVPSSATAMAVPRVEPNMTYTFSTDQQLVQASQSANAWCANQNRRAVTSAISPNVDGTKTVTFQCVPS